MSVVLFKCDWFDPTPNRGTIVHPQYLLVDINSKRSYPKFDPFVVAQQAQQVCFATSRTRIAVRMMMGMIGKQILRRK
jgi:hypothetical protein